jgi:lysophospholipase L1-like esterase
MNSNIKSTLLRSFIASFLLSTLQILSPSTDLFAQETMPPFWKEIQNFKKQDSLSMPPKGGIVFVGSSSFTRWKDLENVYKKYNAINRGFGGSRITQANFYINDVIFPYEPRQVVIYSGENDLAAGSSAVELLNNFATFFSNIRKKLPNTQITYISMKLSPSRVQYADATIHGNKLIKDFLSHYKNTSFVDINPAMKAKDGSLRPELFVKDMLHMQPVGYDIWIKEITPHLIK